ncbi:carboxypeptidase-like regulatory domain-containing protein [Antarcticibacterium sp. 1MA-6-2]|uniref:carboxypeptidase-like regulatory domain-containing protein n=1 Tax=Antarcticibacterium sp. 1MA-6-2 TaxID=2908210 RepID=UPI00288357F2|nr:carboxypeptidase-like regulatory domain-containing protein [Antarcticibacterium sp. 1MA-6-2]
MYKYLCMVFAMLIASSALSQNLIEGKITDAETGQPVFGASVSVPKQEKGSLSSPDGNFRIINLANGNHQLVISSLGYATRTLTVTVPLQNPISITLEPSAIEMEEVIVSTPFHRLQSENVVMVTRATVDDLNRSGAVTLANGISQLPGVETVTTGAGIGKPVIRGLSSNRVLVYAQGVRLENQQYGDEHGLGLSSSGVESVEVIKGLSFIVIRE